MCADKVLIAEIPKGGKAKERWSQGNYTKAIMKDFFEIDPKPGTTQRKTFDWFAKGLNLIPTPSASLKLIPSLAHEGSRVRTVRHVGQGAALGDNRVRGEPPRS